MIAVHLGREQLTVDATAGGVSFTDLSAALRTRYVMSTVQIQAAQVRMTKDGSTAPVAATTGDLLNPGDTFEVWGITNLENLALIRETATSGLAVIDHWGRDGS
jgi:hypothetical protein